MSARRLADHPIHLDRDAGAAVESPISGREWYDGYVARHVEDGDAARLVSQYTFNESWDVWEMHPRGAEVVLCVRGAMILLQQFSDGRVEKVTLGPGEYAINPPGVWHTADIGPGGAEAVFITAGVGTEHCARRPGGGAPADWIAAE